MYGRATITLGIGPISSFFLIFGYLSKMADTRREISFIRSQLLDEEKMLSELLHFARGLAKAKCILVAAAYVSLSVPRRIPTLLYGPGCKLGGMVRGAV